MKQTLAVALLATTMGAFAQTPASTAPAAAPAVTAPAMTCAKPTLPPATKALSQAQAKQLDADGKTYIDCVRSYIDARSAAHKEAIALANANADAVNGATAAGNAFVTELNALNTALKQLNK